MELWDIYDKDKQPTGRLHEKGTDFAEGEYHIAVHVWIVNTKGEILLTRRMPDDTFASMWEPTAGSILQGETSLEGAVREVREELGIELDVTKGSIIGGERRDQYHDFYDACLFRKDFDISDVDLKTAEVDDLKWVTLEEFHHMMNRGEIITTLFYFPDLYKEVIE